MTVSWDPRPDDDGPARLLRRLFAILLVLATVGHFAPPFFGLGG